MEIGKVALHLVFISLFSILLIPMTEMEAKQALRTRYEAANQGHVFRFARTAEELAELDNDLKVWFFSYEVLKSK